jgi:hypothetical protein
VLLITIQPTSASDATDAKPSAEVPAPNIANFVDFAAHESDTFVMVDDLAKKSPSDIFSDFVTAVVLQQCYRRAMIPCLEDPTTAPITVPMIESTSMQKVSLTYSDRRSAFQQLRIAEPDWHIKHNINSINLGRTVAASQASSKSVRDEFNGNFHVDNQFIDAKDISCECCLISNQIDGANPRVYFASNGIVNMEEELRSVFLYHNKNNESGCAFSSNSNSTASETDVQQALATFCLIIAHIFRRGANITHVSVKSRDSNQSTLKSTSGSTTQIIININ